MDGTAWEADGSDLAVAADGVVWATSDTRLLGLGGSEVRGPRQNLHELNTDRITTVAAAGDGGLRLGTPQSIAIRTDRENAGGPVPSQAPHAGR